MEWFPTGKMAGDFLNKPNQVSILKIFRYLIMVVMTQIDPSDRKQGNRNKKETHKSKQE